MSCDPFPNNCVVKFNLRKSCKVGLRRMRYLCGFIVETKWLVAKVGGCSKKLILSVTFPIFGLKFLWIFRYVALICPLFFQCDGYAPAATASSSRSFVKTEPLSPKTGDCEFAYASDIIENDGRDPGHIVKLSY
jgi:hypothetical protein